MTRPPVPPEVLERLARVVGTPHVVVDPDVTAQAARDWTGRFQGATPAVVRPASTDEVAEVLRACAEAGVAVVPQGGNTGLVGGGVALSGEVTVSSARLVETGPIDELSRQVTVGAGTTLARLQELAATRGLTFGVDLAARASATIGGMIATNAGGLHLMRHGPMRAQVVGVEAVRSGGERIGDLRGLWKDNTGYHWPSLLCGSEGTLAFVTRARVALLDRPGEVTVALLAFDDVAGAVHAAGALRHRAEVRAVELILREGIDLVCASFDLVAPFGSIPPAALVVEAAGAPGVVDRLGEVVGALEGVTNAAVAPDRERAAALWRYRELHTDAIGRLGPVHKLDVTLPPDRLGPFVEHVPAAVIARWPGAGVWLFGHAADGNVHVNVTGVDPADEELDAWVLGEVAALGGSISAEHGIGRAKRALLGLNRTDDEIATMVAIRRALDPAGILNPEVLV